MASNSQSLYPPQPPSISIHSSSQISPTATPSSLNPHLSTNPLTTITTITTTSTTPTTTIPTTTTTLPTSASHLHPLTIVPLHPSHLPTYRRLLALLLPIPYQKSFFSEPLNCPSRSIALLALWQSQPQTQPQQPPPSSPHSSFSSTSSPIKEQPTIIGAIQARLCPSESHEDATTLYIQTLVLLAPYRHLGIATQLLSALLARARGLDPGLRVVWAHVWEGNEVGLEWYLKRGFEVRGEVVKGYYRRLRPGGARVVVMEVGGGVEDGGQGGLE